MLKAIDNRTLCSAVVWVNQPTWLSALSSPISAAELRLLALEMEQPEFPFDGLPLSLKTPSKVCSCCHKQKPVSEFYINTASKCGRTSQCKECTISESRKRELREISLNPDAYHARKRATYHRKLAADPAAFRAHRRNEELRHYYGISVDDYNTILAAQGGRCAICGATQSGGRSKRLHVDHDHGTSNVRGLLCNLCNCAIGYFKEDTGILKSAIEYLQNHKQEKQ